MAGVKRQTALDDTAVSAKKKKVSLDLEVPVDKGFAATTKASVYIDPDGEVYDATLNQVNIGNNSNKFYRLQLLRTSPTRYYTHTRWGRVGLSGQQKDMGPYSLDSALKDFEKKFKDKSGLSWANRSTEPKKGKYTFLKKSYPDSDKENENAKSPKDGAVHKDKAKEMSFSTGATSTESVSCNLHPSLRSLMQLIFNEKHFDAVLEEIGYNREKLPLGKLSKDVMLKGYGLLSDLSLVLTTPSHATDVLGVSQPEAIEDLSNRYCTIIPHVSCLNKRLPLINNSGRLESELKMLDTLTDMEVANKIMKKSKEAEAMSILDRRFAELNLDEATPLNDKSNEYRQLATYLSKTAGQTHGITYELENVFRVKRAGEFQRFDNSTYAQRKGSSSCRRLLWHGSRTTNFGGILSQGLRIAPPEAPVNGYAFGKGIYLADMSSKSANYCASDESDGTGLLLLCEAELGNPISELHIGHHNAKEIAEAKKCIGTFGKGRTRPSGWMDAGGVHEDLKGVLMPDLTNPPKDADPGLFLQYNKYIVYDILQVRLRYLLQTQIKPSLY